MGNGFSEETKAGLFLLLFVFIVNEKYKAANQRNLENSIQIKCGENPAKPRVIQFFPEKKIEKTEVRKKVTLKL